MRQKRAKAYKKLMHVYSISYGFRQPYQVLVDSQMCSEIVASKFDLPKQLATVLQGSVKPMITQCSVERLYAAGRSAQPVVDLAKTFERRRCNHREPIPEDDCMKDVLGLTNKHRYVLAAQSQSLRQHARQVPGVPIVHVKRSVMVLEPASVATERAKAAMEDDRMRPSKAETSAITSTLEATEGDRSGTVPNAPPKKKKHGPKGPNPLSVKKKKPREPGRLPQAANPKETTVERLEMVGEKRKLYDEDLGPTRKDDEVLPHQNGEEVVVKRTRKRVRKRKKLENENTAVQTREVGSTEP